jgi:16S rRNA (cytidine1402-2'-O)-methyltransferase
MESGSLYIVSTPIGNMQDITIRAIKTLFEVDVIFSEQAQKTSLLLSKLSQDYPHFVPETHKPRIISFNEFEEESKIYDVIQLIEAGQNVALVSEAGTPLISDPGFKLVRRARSHNIRIIPVPGASSVIASLTVSGLPTDKFGFIGFPPKPIGKKTHFFEKLKRSREVIEKEFLLTIIFFESPHRISDTLEVLKNVFGDIEIVIARELTKIYEEVLSGKISELMEDPSIKNPKGEFVVMFNNKS